MSGLRKIKEVSGKMAIVELPEETLEALDRAIDIMDDGWVDESVVLHELGITKKNLLNLMYRGKITKDMYCVAVNGSRKYDFKKIIGLKK
jgi:hypothetical protein